MSLTIRCGEEERRRIHQSCADWNAMLKNKGVRISVSDIVRFVFFDVDQKLAKGEEIQWPPALVTEPKKRKRPKRPKK